MHRHAEMESERLFKLDDASSTPPKKKQKRNKPTLSCEECVERKTKVRPSPSSPLATYPSSRGCCQWMAATKLPANVNAASV